MFNPYPVAMHPSTGKMNNEQLALVRNNLLCDQRSSIEESNYTFSSREKTILGPLKFNKI